MQQKLTTTSKKMDIAKELWKENKELIDQCLNHPFVQGMKQGTLDKEAFKRYVAQDAFFLNAFLKAYALALAKSDKVEDAKRFHKYISGVFEELALHATYSKELGIDLQNVSPLPECAAYTNFLLHTAEKEDVPSILAAIAPCMTLYAYLGAQLKPEMNKDNPYFSWADNYSSSEFQQLAQDVEEFLNSRAEKNKKIQDLYEHAMMCEKNFFSGPLQ